MTGETVTITHWPNPHGTRDEDVAVDVTGVVVSEDVHYITVHIDGEQHTYSKRRAIVRREGDVGRAMSTYTNRSKNMKEPTSHDSQSGVAS